MSTKRPWAIAGAVVGVLAIVGVVIVAFVPRSAEPSPSPTVTASSAPAATMTASSTPTPTVTSPVAVEATCQNTSTEVFRTAIAPQNWVSWETQDQQIGARPFDAFPNGPPQGAIVCRWGADPDVATDNVIDLAWSPIDPEDAAAAMTALEASGYVRIEAADGTYLAIPGEPGWSDAEGWGTTYLFGPDDVRWAITKADVTDYVKAPTEAG